MMRLAREENSPLTPGDQTVRQAVFLDRDGTINVRPPDHEYVRCWQDFRWLPGALEAIVGLDRAGLPVVIVSNQRGVSRGIVTEEGLLSIERGIQDALGAHGVSIQMFRYCTHAIEDDCHCRKPKPGLLLSAAEELDVDPRRCWMIGDSDEDEAAGVSAGCRVVRISSAPSSTVATARSLLEAAELVLASIGLRQSGPHVSAMVGSSPVTRRTRSAETR